MVTANGEHYEGAFRGNNPDNLTQFKLQYLTIISQIEGKPYSHITKIPGPRVFDLKDCEYITIHGIADMESVITAPPKTKKKELCKYEHEVAGGTELDKVEYNKFFNQFEELHKKTNYVSTYDEAIYTTELNVNKLTSAQIDKALKISSEIEKNATLQNESENEERDFSQVIREPQIAKKEDEASLKKMLECVICKDINITTGLLNTEESIIPTIQLNTEIQPSTEVPLNADAQTPQDVNKMSGISTDEFTYEAQEIKLFREKRELSPTNYKYRKRHSLEQTIGNFDIEVPKIDKELMQKYRRFRANKNIPDKESFINFSKNYKLRPFRSASKEKAKLIPTPQASEVEKDTKDQEQISNDALPLVQAQSSQTDHLPIKLELLPIKSNLQNQSIVNQEVDSKKEETKKIEFPNKIVETTKLESKEAKKTAELRIDAKPYVPSFTNIPQAPATSIGMMPVNIVYYDPNQIQPPVGAQIYGYNYAYNPYQQNYQYGYNYPSTDYYTDPNINKYKK